jgi:hypothetical protein
LIIPLIIQATELLRSRSGQLDAASSVSRENPTGTDRSD